MKGNVKCSCGHSWNTSDSSKKDASVCHICGKDNTMKDGGWLDKYEPGGTVAKTDATRVAAPALKLTKAQLEKNKAINKQVMANTNKAKEAEVAKRTTARNKPGKTVSEVFTSKEPYEIQERFRLFPGDTEYGQVFDEYINPAYFTTQMASDLGNSLQSGDYKGAALTAGMALGAGALGFDPLGGAMKLPGKLDKAIYPTRTYRASSPVGNTSPYEVSALAEKVAGKGDWSTKDLSEAAQYVSGSEMSGGRPGLLTGQNMNLTEYKVPFWKKSVASDADVIALKASQGTVPNPNEYIIPDNKFLYPRRTNVLQQVPENVKNAKFTIGSGEQFPYYNPRSMPGSYSSDTFRSPAYKYIEDQINAVTGQQMPLTYTAEQAAANQIPMFNWKQPQIAPNKGMGEFSGLGDYLTTQTPLANTYNIIPFAIKENPEMYLYRVQPENFNTQNTIDFMRQELLANRSKPWYKSVINSYEEGHPSLVAQNDFHGRWYESNPERLDWYLHSGDKVDVGTPMEILRGKINKNSSSKFSIKNNPKANPVSLSPETEFVVPKNITESFEKFPESSWKKLIEEDKKFNTPHWLKGYKGVPKPSVNFSKYLTQEEAIAARAKRLISQKDKPGWNEQFTPDLETRLKNAVKNHDPASDYPGEKLGSNILGRTATLVSKDANLSGVPLTEANKARVAAHETGHYYSNSVAEGEEWLKPFNLNKLESYKTKTYLRGKSRSNNYANEIRERAAQLKDYIAQKNEIPLNQDFKITQTQLDDAIKNYVKDTGLDNTMSKMLGTLEDKKGLLKTMNKYPLGAAPVGIVAGALQQKKEDGGWLDKYQDGGELNYNDSNASAGPGFQGDGYSNVGRNYSPAWGGQFAMGGSIPGSVGFMYARTNDPAPSNGKYAKKTMASAQNGTEMEYYQNGLDWKPRSMDDGGEVVPGENEELQIPSAWDDKMASIKKTRLRGPGTRTRFMPPQLLDEDQFEVEDVNYDQLSAPHFVNSLTPVESKNYIPKMQDRFTDMENMYYTKNAEFNENWSNLNLLDESSNKIKLNTGRFTGAKVPTNIIDELAKTSRKQNVSLGQLLTLMGRESMFGSGTDRNEDRAGSKTSLMSGWNVAEDYQPYNNIRFLADNKVPGVKPTPTPHGYEYEITDERAMNNYLKKNPKLLDQYKAKLDSTKVLGDQDAFDLAAKFLKKKGIKGYNPGDPRYEEMFQKDYDTLKQDKALMSYLKKKGYKYEQGGQLTKLDQLTNFSNYNTKQPGGWLDKYQ